MHPLCAARAASALLGGCAPPGPASAAPDAGSPAASPAPDSPGSSADAPGSAALAAPGAAANTPVAAAPRPESEVGRYVAVAGGTLGTRTIAAHTIAAHTIAAHTIAALEVKQTEVTVAEYARCVAAGVCTAAATWTGCNADVADRQAHPINCVTWTQAQDYCGWAGSRLPSKWEWEWAARGREDARPYPWGSEPPTCERAVMDQGGDGCGAQSTAAVDSRPAGRSRDGLADLAGNVLEWTASTSDDAPASYVTRGGSWLDEVARELRADDRAFAFPPGVDAVALGFRCVRAPAG